MRRESHAGLEMQLSYQFVLNDKNRISISQEQNTYPIQAYLKKTPRAQMSKEKETRIKVIAPSSFIVIEELNYYWKGGLIAQVSRTYGVFVISHRDAIYIATENIAQIRIRSPKEFYVFRESILCKKIGQSDIEKLKNGEISEEVSSFIQDLKNKK